MGFNPLIINCNVLKPIGVIVNVFLSIIKAIFFIKNIIFTRFLSDAQK